MDEKQNKLVSQLTERTNQGKQQWNSTSDKNLFETTVGSFRISVMYNDPEDDIITSWPGQKTAELTVKEFAGNVFDRISSFDRSSDDFKKLKKLFDLAKRNVLKIDEKYDKIFLILGAK